MICTQNSNYQFSLEVGVAEVEGDIIQNTVTQTPISLSYIPQVIPNYEITFDEPLIIEVENQTIIEKVDNKTFKEVEFQSACAIKVENSTYDV